MSDYDDPLVETTSRPTQLLITYPEAARLLATSTRTVRRLVHSGVLERIALPLGPSDHGRGRPKVRLASVRRLVERSVAPRQRITSKPIEVRRLAPRASRRPVKTDLKPGDESRNGSENVDPRAGSRDGGIAR